MQIKFYKLETIDSTNEWAKKNLTVFKKNSLSVITAKEQTHGKGRDNKQWVSPSDSNLYCTYVFFSQINYNSVGNIPQVLALSLIDFLQRLNLTAHIKWPNDVLINNKKIAGILCETISIENQQAIILGFGLNINMPFNEEIAKPHTSLFIEKNEQYNIERINQVLASFFVKSLSLFLREGFSPFYEQFKRYLWLNNGIIRFSSNGAVWEGYVDSINHDGSLNLLLENGKIKTFISGEFIN
ncbi:Bifunctional protein BirA [Candidatus Rubidus massiliensis]|nr:Bifunctional protein BirA [Candidatus Rubidus massiliensis]